MASLTCRAPHPKRSSSSRAGYAWAKKYTLPPSTVNLTSVPGDVFAYMVRQRAPRNIIMGPMQILPDGQTVAVQGNPNLSGFRAPEPGVHLLYLGRRSDHPLRICAMETDAEAAKEFIFAVEEVSFQPYDQTTPMYSLQSELLSQSSGSSWSQITPWILAGLVPVPPSSIVSGLQYEWPYPDQAMFET